MPVDRATYRKYVPASAIETGVCGGTERKTLEMSA